MDERAEQIEFPSSKNCCGKVRECNEVSELFVEICTSQLEKVFNILFSRLPRSAHVYTMAKMKAKFPDIKVYSYRGLLSEHSVFVLTCVREDFGQDLNISVDENFEPHVEIKTAFMNTCIINWDMPYIFSAVDRLISPMILEISTIVKRNATSCNPNYYYYLLPSEVPELVQKRRRESFSMKSRKIEGKLGVDFIVDNWKYNRGGSKEYTKRVVANAPSCAIYIDNLPASAIMLNANGLMGMLYTGEDYRGLGLGKQCVNDLMGHLASAGLPSASCVEQKNISSKKFHDNVGLKLSHECDYIFYNGSKW